MVEVGELYNRAAASANSFVCFIMPFDHSGRKGRHCQQITDRPFAGEKKDRHARVCWGDGIETR